MIHLLEEERGKKEKRKRKKKKSNAGKRDSAGCSCSALKNPQCLDVGGWQGLNYLVSHSGRTLLPQTQGRRHVSQHLIHVRVRHAAPGSTKNKKRRWERRTKGRVGGGRGRKGSGKKQKKKKKNHTSRKNRERKMQRTIKEVFQINKKRGEKNGRGN